MSKVIVIGGGAAGMMAAISASDQGHQVVLLERNEKLGKKIYITGKGRCNITNDSDVENLLQHTMSNAKFLYSAFYTFNSQQMMDFLESEGLDIKTERGNRVFPVSDHSSDVIRTLQNAMKKRGVKVLFQSRVKKLLTTEGRCSGVIYQNDGSREEKLLGDAVIVATGGLSYPTTGSTGDGYQFAEATGHKVTEQYPSLVALNIKEDFVKELQGLSLRNITLTLSCGKKVIYQDLGEMLFTHYGISGPLVLSASSYAAGSKKDLLLSLDLKPALSEKQLDERILRDFGGCKNSFFKNSLGKLLPAKLAPVMVRLSGIDPEKPVNEVIKEERQKLVTLMKHLPLTIDSLRGYNEAVITRGGVSVKDVDPGTMESKVLSGLYFAGEVLDLDAMTGGYNLQIAWSTGYLAGLNV